MPRARPEINASSMADIAFLLLVFFLVTTTIDSDKGLTVKLPPMPENEDEIVDSRQNKRNVLNILVNSKDEMLVNDDVTRVLELKKITIDFVNNKGLDPTKSDSPDEAVVSLKNDNGTTYAMYLSVHNELKAAYNVMWAEEAMKQYGRTYEELTNEERRTVREIYPYRISEAEPVDYGEAEQE